MTPEDTQRIERTGLELIGELDGSPDAFYQRTRMRLEQLNDKLLDWGEGAERAKVIEDIKRDVPAQYKPMIDEYFKSLNRIHGFNK